MVSYHNCKNCGSPIDLRLEQCNYCGSFFREQPKPPAKPISPPPEPKVESESKPSIQTFTYSDPKYQGLYIHEEPDEFWENVIAVVMNAGLLFLFFWFFKIMYRS